MQDRVLHCGSVSLSLVWIFFRGKLTVPKGYKSCETGKGNSALGGQGLHGIVVEDLFTW